MRVVPDELVTAAQRLDIVWSDLGTANLTALRNTTRIAAAGQDEISVSLSNLFSTFAKQFHTAIEQTGIIDTQRFARGLTSAAANYSTRDQINAIQQQVTIAGEFALGASVLGSIELAYLSLKVSYPFTWLFLKYGGVLAGTGDGTVGLPTPTLSNPFLPGPWLFWNIYAPEGW